MAYEVKNEKDLPPGVTAAFLDDLHNCIFMFGLENTEDGMRRLRHTEPEITVCVSTDHAISTLLVFGEGGQMTGGCYCAQFKDGGMLLWDKRVPFAAVKLFVAKVDALFLKMGWIDLTNGSRVRRGHLVEKPGKRSVERTFTQPRAVLIVPPDKDAQAMRQEFDHPDELAVFVSSFGGEGLCRSEDLAAITARHKAAAGILSELGYDDLTKLPKDTEGILALREEIEKRLEALNLPKG